MDVRLTVAVLAFLSATASGAEWRCRNSVEIHCTEGTCKAIDREETSTMDVSFNYDGEFSVCAYSGCWSGRGQIHLDRQFLFIWKERAEWSFEPDRESRRSDVLIAFDQSDQVALVKVGGFAHPFNCELK